MLSHIPRSMKPLFLLPFGLMAGTGILLGALLLGPTNAVLGQVVAPSEEVGAPAMAPGPAVAEPRATTTVRGPF